MLPVERYLLPRGALTMRRPRLSCSTGVSLVLMGQIVPGVLGVPRDQDFKLLDLHDLRCAGELHRVQHGVELCK